MEIKIKMFRELQGNLIISFTGLGLGYLSKKILHKEFLPVSSVRQAVISLGFLFGMTVAGKMVMDELVVFNLVRFDTTGKEKHPYEGFIGPLEKDDWILGFGPNRRNRQIIQDMKKDNRRNKN